MTTNFFKKAGFLSLLLSFGLFMACNKSDDAGTPDPVASFQFAVDGTNFLQVTFTNFSSDATSYSWDFGDGNTSTDPNPVHTFAATGNYTVTLTASNDASVSATKSETLAITDPDELLTLLAGTTSKEWIMQREQIAIYLGPNAYDGSWWSFGGVTPLAERPCILDDRYTFERGGAFLKNTNGTFFMDSEANGGWNDAQFGEGCVDETSAGAFTASGNSADYGALANGGTYTYTFDTNSTPNTITLAGEGAYMGLPKTIVDGDLGNNNALPVTTSFEVLNLVDGPVADSLQLLVNGVWTYMFVSYDDPNDEPPIPTLLPTADFSFTANDLAVDFTNSSNAAAVNFAWDFGDGTGSSTDENPSYTYASAGTYQVKLDTDDGNGNTATVTKEVVVGVALIAPTSMGHTFDTGGADLLVNHEGNSLITYGATDPAGGGTGVGEFNRQAGINFQELILSMEPAQDIDFSNLTNVSIDVYLPSTNDHTGALTRTVIVGVSDFKVNPSGNWWEEHAQYETTLDAAQEDQWVTLTWPLDTPISGGNTADPDTRNDLDMVFINIGGGNHGVGAIFYVRNLVFN